MDFKTTILPNELETKEVLLQEFENLKFGILGDKLALFDYTAYIEAEGLPDINYKAFMRNNIRFIQIIAEYTGKSTSSLFFQNTNGHILVAAELAFLFLAYVNPELCAYFNSLLADVITDGVAYSQSFLYNKVYERLPSETLQEIVKERASNNDNDEQQSVNHSGF